MLESDKKQKGVSLYLALMVMAIMLGISLGLSSIFLGQMKTVKQVGDSVMALCAADAGIEAVLLNRANPADISGILSNNDATYQVSVTACVPEESCYYHIRSIGTYLETQRAIEITY